MNLARSGINWTGGINPNSREGVNNLGKKQDKLKGQVGTPGSTAGKIKGKNKSTADMLKEAGQTGAKGTRKPAKKKKGAF